MSTLDKISITMPAEMVSRVRADATLSCRSFSGQVQHMVNYYYDVLAAMPDISAADRRVRQLPMNEPLPAHEIIRGDLPGS